MARRGKATAFKCPSFTKDQILAYTHLTRLEASESLGIAEGTLSRYCKFHGIKSSEFVRNLRGDDITKKEMLSCAGMSKEKACKKLGISRPVLNGLLEWYKIESLYKLKAQ